MGKITRLRPKRHDVILESLQYVLDFADEWELQQATKDDVSQAIGRLLPVEKWGFVMLNPGQIRAVTRAIKDGSSPGETLAVWNICISFIGYDRDGEIMASRKQIAEEAGLFLQHASRALSRLVEIGVLIRIGKGRFRVNSHVAQHRRMHLPCAGHFQPAAFQCTTAKGNVDLG